MSTKNAIATASAGMAGALLMYFFDSRLGARRRAILRDKIIHFSRLGRRAASITARDAIHRAEGAWAEASHMLKRETVPDEILTERVRSQLGRVVSHPGSIEVSARNGGVTLRGSAIDSEHDRLLRSVHKIRGVESVRDQLKVQRQSERLAELQGGAPRRPRSELMQSNWAPAIRALVLAAAGGAMGYGLTRRNPAGLTLAGVAAPLAARALTNVAFSRMAEAARRLRAS